MVIVDPATKQSPAYIRSSSWVDVCIISPLLAVNVSLKSHDLFRASEELPLFSWSLAIPVSALQHIWFPRPFQKLENQFIQWPSRVMPVLNDCKIPSKSQPRRDSIFFQTCSGHRSNWWLLYRPALVTQRPPHIESTPRCHVSQMFMKPRLDTLRVGNIGGGNIPKSMREWLRLRIWGNTFIMDECTTLHDAIEFAI